MLELVVELTVWVVRVVEAEEAPAGMVMLEGTLTAELPPERVTFAPPDGAGPEMLTVSVDFREPPSEAGERTTVESAGGVRLSVVEALVAPLCAEMEAVVAVETAVVLTEKVAEVAPAATVTWAGALTEEVLEVRATTRPPAGAAVVSVTVPDALKPPVTAFGFTDMDCTPTFKTV